MTLMVAGAINTDFVALMERAPEAGETITARSFSTFPGGKGANQAVSAARNGASVVMLGATGDDDIGDARRADLEAAGVDASRVYRDPAHSSGVALILVEAGGENRIAYVPGATIHIPTEACVDAFNATPPRMLLAPNELPHEALLALFQHAKKDGVPVVLNVTPDPERASDLVPLADVVIANQSEAAALFGVSGEDPDVVRRAATAAGVNRLVVTLGGRGALWIDGDAGGHEACPDVVAIDTTGAGDAFCGAFAAALLRGESFAVAVRYGVYAGSIATTIPGAQTSSPTRAAIEALMGP